MGKASKIILTVILGVVTLVSLLLIVDFTVSIPDLNYPATVIMPLIALTFLAAGSLTVIFWIFKRKSAALIVGIALIAIAILLLPISRAVNETITPDFSALDSFVLWYDKI